jgi:hypothetical protein
MIVGLIVLLVVAFYGGRAYQNNIDQKLFNDYNPAAVGSGRSFAAGGQSALVRAALSAGTPPGTSSTTTGTQPGTTGGGAGAQGQRVIGTVASTSATSLGIQSFSGTTQSVAVGPQTRFYETQTATASALTPGTHVTVSYTGSGINLTAVSVTIGPAGLAAGGRRFGGGGFGGVATSTVSGAIAASLNGSITVGGKTIAVSSSTRISRLVSVSRSAVASGSFVTVQLGSNQVATSVVVRATGTTQGGFPSGNGFPGSPNG